VDWPSLLHTIEATGAERILLTHGYTSVVARWLHSQGKNADIIATRYTGERDDVQETDALAEPDNSRGGEAPAKPGYPREGKALAGPDSS